MVIADYLGDVVDPDTSKPVADLIVAYLSNFKKVSDQSSCTSLHMRHERPPSFLKVPYGLDTFAKMGDVLVRSCIRAPCAPHGEIIRLGDLAWSE